MDYIESLESLAAARQAALEQGRQTLLELAFGCAKKLVSPREYQIEDLTYTIAQLLFPSPHYANLEIPQNWTGIRINVSRAPGSEIPSFWPPNTTNEVLECVFSLSRETSPQSKFGCERLYIDGDKRKTDQGLSSEAITALTNELLTLLTSASSKT